LGTPKIGTSKGKPKQSANKVIAGICLAASSMGKFHFLWMGAPSGFPQVFPGFLCRLLLGQGI